MSYNTPSKPSFDRSSMTPPSAEARRPSARMKPESERLKQRRILERPRSLVAARVYLEDQQKYDTDRARKRRRSRERRVPFDLESDDAGAGPLDKDDAPYQGRSTRPRIASVRVAREGYGTETRERSEIGRDPSLSPPTSAQAPHADRGVDLATAAVGGTVEMGVRPRTSAQNRPKRIWKSASTVEDSDQYDSEAPAQHLKRARVEKDDVQVGETRRRQTKSMPKPDWSFIRTPSPPPRPLSPLPPVPPLPDFGSDPELPTLLEIMRQERSLVDDEALDSGMEEGGGLESEYAVRDGITDDEYDYDDPFINDGDITSEHSESSSSSFGPRNHATASRLAPAFEERPSRRRESSSSDDEELEKEGYKLKRLQRGVRPASKMINSTVISAESVPADKPSSTEVSKPRPKPKPVKKVSTAMAQPSLDPKRIVYAGPRSNAGEALTTPAKDKGKAKAVVLDIEAEEDLGGQGDDASNMSPWERSQLERAIELSKRSNVSPSAGEGSGHGSQLCTPKAIDMFSSQSPALKTPQAREMFGTPSGSSSVQETPTPFDLPATQDASPLTMEELVALSQSDPQGTVTQAPPTATAPPPPTRPRKVVLKMLCLLSDLPTFDETFNVAFQDPLLRKQYGNLVALRNGHIESWSNMTGTGFVMFTAWAKQCPRMNARLALDAVNFKECGHFRNPSRCSPVDVGIYEVPDQDRFHFYCAGDDPEPLIAVSSGMLEHSQVTEPSAGGLRQRWVRAILHNQEWQRYKGFIRMVSGYDYLHAQYNKHALQFSTRPLYKASDKGYGQGKGKPRSGPSTGLRVPVSDMFGSGGDAESQSNRVSADTFSLPAETPVPVYDARRAVSFNFNTDLPRLSELLPPWEDREIPFGSFVVIGHTIAVYRARNGNWTLGCNLLWVIVVGSGSEG